MGALGLAENEQPVPRPQIGKRFINLGAAGDAAAGESKAGDAAGGGGGGDDFMTKSRSISGHPSGRVSGRSSRGIDIADFPDSAAAPGGGAGGRGGDDDADSDSGHQEVGYVLPCCCCVHLVLLLLLLEGMAS